MKKKSRKISKENITIIAIFLAMLYLPTLTFPFFQGNFGNDDSENRVLAEMPELSAEHLDQFPKQFDAYYNDHLPYRVGLRSVWTNLNLFLLHDSTNGNVVIGKTDGDFSRSWLFYSNDMDFNAIKETQGLISYSREQSDNMIATMRRNTELAKNRGVELYYFIAPDKENIHREKLPDNIFIYNNETGTDRFVKYAQSQNVKNIIYPKTELIDAEKDCQTYYRQDTHWNSCGGFVGFREITKRVSPEYDFPDNITFHKSREVKQDLAGMMGVRGYFEDEDEIADYLNDSNYEVEVITGGVKGIELYKNESAPIKKTILISGDSFRTAMKQYFGKTYEKCIFLHRDSYKKNLISTYHPDIMILEFVGRASSLIRFTNI